MNKIEEIDELKDLTEMIRRYIASNKYGVAFVANFVAFDKDGSIKNNASRIMAFGEEELLEMMVDGLKEIIKKGVDEDNFVSI